GFQVGEDVIVIDARKYLGATPRDAGNRLFNETSGVGFKVLRYGVFQVQVDVVAATAPGVIDKAFRDHRHGESGATYRMLCHTVLQRGPHYGIVSGGRAKASAFSWSRTAQASARASSCCAWAAVPRSMIRSPCLVAPAPCAIPAW